MSLINIKNFVTPVTNPVHLVSIGVVALMFLILRLAGGGITINTEIETPKLMRKGDRQQIRRDSPPSAADDLLMDGFGADDGMETGSEKRSGKPIWESETREVKPRKDNTGRSANEGLGSIDDMLSGGSEKRGTSDKREPKQQEDPKGKGLAEIEKSLGLL